MSRNISSANSARSNLASSKKVTELKHPANKNWLIHLHYVRREFTTCKSIIMEELSRLNGNSEYANYILALILRSEGKLQESLEKLQICHELEPNKSNTIKQIARSLFLLGRHKLAIEAYQKAQLLNEESDSEAFYNMGMCYLFMKDLEKAKEFMNLSLQTKVSVEAFEILGQISLAKNNVPETVNIYEKAMRIFPENPQILGNLGILYMKLGRDELSFRRLSASLSFEPNNSKAIVATASMMQTFEDFDYALAKYNTAMQNIPDSASLWNNIGMAFFGKKKYVAAISCLKRAMYLNPFDWKIQHNLGLVHLYMQQYASAFHFLTASINLKPDQSHNFMLLAVAISHLDDIDHSIQSYDQALNLNQIQQTSDNFPLLLNYAVSLYNHKKFPESYQKLLAAHRQLEDSGGNLADEDMRDTLTRLKNSLKLMDYQFPEKNLEKPSSSKGLTGTRGNDAGKPVISQQKVDLHQTQAQGENKKFDDVQQQNEGNQENLDEDLV